MTWPTARARGAGAAVGAAVGLMLAAGVTSADAQLVTVRGRVVADSTDQPISGALVSIAFLKLQATSDTLGNFVLSGVTPGAQVVTVRKVGFAEFQQRIQFNAGDVVDIDLVLAPIAQALPGVTVAAAPAPNAKLSEFEERRATAAGGHFLTEKDFEKRMSSLTSDVMRTLPGIEFLRDTNRGSAFYVISGRMQTARGALAGGSSRPRPCFAAVVLDGVFVFSGNENEPVFDINSISPAHIAGMEYYASTATVPTKYNGTRNTCGLVVIWTR